jgi:hypothetical protein
MSHVLDSFIRKGLTKITEKSIGEQENAKRYAEKNIESK